MKICAISDMHGYLPYDIDKCDLLLICGDIVPLGLQKDAKRSLRWFSSEFIPWAHDMPCEKVMFVGGNHDFFLESSKGKVLNALNGHDKISYLDMSSDEYGGIKVFGSPLCKIFGNWAFMETQAKQDELFSVALDEIRESGKPVDILITHDAPYGTSDQILEKCAWYTPDHIGNMALASFVEKLSPRFHLHGHLHSSNHEVEMIGTTEVYNVSLLSEEYKPVYRPLYIEV